MSMTAEERAKALVALLMSDFGQSGVDVVFYAIRDELKAHANAALEAAAKMIEKTEYVHPAVGAVPIGRDMAAAIRALREEE